MTIKLSSILRDHNDALLGFTVFAMLLDTYEFMINAGLTDSAYAARLFNGLILGRRRRRRRKKRSPESLHDHTYASVDGSDYEDADFYPALPEEDEFMKDAEEYQQQMIYKVVYKVTDVWIS